MKAKPALPERVRSMEGLGIVGRVLKPVREARFSEHAKEDLLVFMIPTPSMRLGHSLLGCFGFHHVWSLEDEPKIEDLMRQRPLTRSCGKQVQRVGKEEGMKLGMELKRSALVVFCVLEEVEFLVVSLDDALAAFIERSIILDHACLALRVVVKNLVGRMYKCVNCNGASILEEEGDSFQQLFSCGIKLGYLSEFQFVNGHICDA